MNYPSDLTPSEMSIEALRAALTYPQVRRDPNLAQRLRGELQRRERAWRLV